MAKRLTDSNKWNDNWFNELSAEMKLVWIYILDTCDHAGVYKVSFKSIRFYTGTKATENEIIECLKERIYIVDNGNKWFIPKFITFQYKNFFVSNAPVIKSARELLISHNIIQPNDNVLPIITKELYKGYLTIDKGLDNDYITTKDKDKDNNKDNNMDNNMDKVKATDNVMDIVLDSDMSRANRQDMLAATFDNIFSDIKQ